MLKYLNIAFLFVVIASLASGQEQKNTYKSLKLDSFSSSRYPLLSQCFDYYSFSDSSKLITVFLTENGIKCPGLSIEPTENQQDLNLHYIPLNLDTGKLSTYVHKLALWKQTGLIADLVLRDDSVFNANKPEEWLKNTNNRIITADTSSLIKLCKSYLSTFHRPKDIFIFLIGDTDLKIFSLINSSLKSLAGSNPPFFILLYQKPRLKGNIPDFNIDDSLKIGSLQFDPEKSDPSSILSLLKPILNLSKTVTWKTPEPLNLNLYRTINISTNGLSEKIQVVLPDSVVRRYFINSTISSADSMIMTKQFSACTKLLNNRYLLLPASEFIKEAETNFDSLAVSLLSEKNKTPFSSFIAIESTNKLPLRGEYHIKSLKHIKEFYNMIDRSDSLNDERLKTAEYLYTAAPENKENNFIFHLAKARLFNAEKNTWKALDEYKLAFTVSENEKVRSEIIRLINVCLLDAYLQKDWSRIKLYGSRFYEFIQQSFTLRCIYGRACYELADYQVAITQFEWLVFNWQNNNYVGWEEAFNYLQHAYTLSFRFDEAINLNQRIFREKQNIESLHLALLNLRLKWLKPVLDAFNIWIKTIPVSNQVAGSINLTRIGLPQYFLSFRICEKNGSIIETLFENKQFKGQYKNIPAGGQSISPIMLENYNQWLSSRIVNNRFILIQLANSEMDEQEKTFLASINKDPTNNQIWKQLFMYEEKNGVRLFTQILAALTGSSIQFTGSTEVEQYWDAVKGNKELEYIVNLRRDGTTCFQQGFDRKKSTFSDEDWQKSLKTTSFYLIETKYRNSDIYDITNPVFGKTGWEGTLRVGIKKQY